MVASTRRRLSTIAVCTALLSGLVSLLAPPATAGTGGPLLYGVTVWWNGNPIVQPFDGATGNLAGPNQTITNAGGPVTGVITSGNALAVDPTTGTAYTLVQIDGLDRQHRALATLNLTNGQATTIANTGLGISSITFAPDGTLYAVTGSGDATCDACLYTLNKTTGAATFRKDLGTGDKCCGEQISYHPTEARIYHSSGRFDDAVFDKIDPANAFAITNIGLSGDGPPQEPIGMVFDPVAGNFIVGAFDHVYTISTAGVASEIGNFDLHDTFLRGYARPTQPTSPVAVDDFPTVARDGGAQVIDVLGNDIDGTVTPVGTIASASTPSNGTVVVAGSGSNLTYEPAGITCNANAFNFEDTFTYQLNTGPEATVFVNIACPTFQRTLTLKYLADTGVFKGKVSSPNPEACAAKYRRVDIFKKRSSGDKLIGSVLSQPNGSYSLRRAVRGGRFYSRVAGQSLPNKAECPVAVSPTIRVA